MLPSGLEDELLNFDRALDEAAASHSRIMKTLSRGSKGAWSLIQMNSAALQSIVQTTERRYWKSPKKTRLCAQRMLAHCDLISNFPIGLFSDAMHQEDAFRCQEWPVVFAIRHDCFG